MNRDAPRATASGDTSGRATLGALLVEDSVIIAMDAEDCLRELGVGHVNSAADVAGALAALADSSPDLALLDFNLGAETAEAVAAELVRRGIPFWLATGDVELETRLGELGARGLLIKPYGKREIAGMLEELNRPA